MKRRVLLRFVSTAGGVGLAGCLDAFGRSGTNQDGYGDWFEGVENYGGAVDRTGRESVTVRVGAEGNGGYFAFAPAAVDVSTGTTVVWRWTGKGGRHNVVSEGGAFESAFATRSGYTFEHQFPDTGVFPYYCKPHRSLGMKGGVRVVE